MAERPPGVDYATTKDDPSKTDYPHATETASPAGEQAQGEGERSQLVGCCILSGCATHTWSACKFPVTRYCCHSLSELILGLSRGDDVSHPASYSPEVKRKKVSLATSGERHMKVQCATASSQVRATEDSYKFTLRASPRG